MSEPEQNQKSENRHASFSDAEPVIQHLARRIVDASIGLCVPGFEPWREMMNKAVPTIEAAWPDLEKHFRQKFESEEGVKKSLAEFDEVVQKYLKVHNNPMKSWYNINPQKLTASKTPQTTDTISDRVNALANALHEVEKTVEGGQARYKTQSDDTKESILKALSVLAFEARKECHPSQVVSAENPPQKYPDEYYNLDRIANRITNKVKLYPNLPFDDLQKEIRAELNVLEEKL
jgi:hypothetical protein